MNKKEPTSKRRVARDQRVKKQRQQRLMIIIGIAIAAVVIAALLIIPQIQKSNAPVGEVTPIVSKTLPNPNWTSLGDPNAKVKIDVFSDFQCPGCQYWAMGVEPLVIEELVATGKAYYTFHNYPFIDDRAPMKESDQAANGALCAADQGRFWDYHDIVYANWNGENQGWFTDARLVAFAESVKLDMKAFNACYKAKKFQSKIDEDLLYGKRLGLAATPSIYVNEKLVENPSFEEIKKAVESAQAGG